MKISVGGMAKASACVFSEMPTIHRIGKIETKDAMQSVNRIMSECAGRVQDAVSFLGSLVAVDHGVAHSVCKDQH